MKPKSLVHRETGFTLIELLVVIGIIGVLAGVAIPQYAYYRTKAFDTRAEMDLNQVMVAEEAYFAENDVYVSCTQADCAALLPELRDLSPGVVLEVIAASDSLAISASHPMGTGTTFTWSTAAGFGTT